MKKLAMAKLYISQALRMFRPIAKGLAVLCLLGTTLSGMGQSGTSSAITGTVVDPSRSVIVGAAVTASKVNTRATRATQSDTTGRFLFSQLNPGTYQIEVVAQGFAPQKSASITVAVGQIAAANFTLSLAGTSQTVEVIAESGLMSLENPNTSTMLDAKTIKNLPNPGQDLTFVAQFAQGALMNTAGSSNNAKAGLSIR